MNRFVLFFLSFFSCLSLSSQTEWPIYIYGNHCSFRVPATLELRDKDSKLGRTCDLLKKYIDMSYDDEAVFQPVGANSDDIETIKNSMGHYARIIIRCIPQNDIDQSLVSSLTQADLNELNKVWKQEAEEFFSGEDFKWYQLTSKKIGGKYALITKYQRPGLKGVVLVEEYKFFLKGKLIRFTLSYRMSDSYIWKSDFEKIMGTLSFN